ncbi:LysR family transcriptional regulator [Sedimentitalea sp. HM32M-2]|uniref:LysR family transcriptional regulator n=1 Tax=Sedimentitalea sp. HM32M-2 TaxID=3351566 RepID=UPI00363F46C1
MHSQNWDNLRFVLTVADHGSVSAAARALGVNHATVLRRVAAFEADHGGPVFEKSASGYRVLPAREKVIEAARDVENAVMSVSRLMHGAMAPLRGLVRVSSTDSFCQMLLPPVAARLHAESAELQINLLSSNSHLDFARMQADISVRPARNLPEGMVGKSVANLAFRAYATADAPRRWLGLSGALGRSAPGVWMAEAVAPDQIVAGADSFMVLRELARTGMGIAVLPVFVGAVTPGLRPLPRAIPEMAVPIWVGTHSDLCDVPRIRIVRDRILQFLADRADALAGTN